MPAENTPAPTPHRAIYGFAVFLLFKTIFFLYLFWAFVPDNILENHLGLTYMPHKYFALFLPVLVLMGLVFFGFFIYPSMNLAMTLPPDDIRTLRDSFTIRRCRFVDCRNGGHACDRKVRYDTGQHGDDWTVPLFCEQHITERNSDWKTQNEDIKIADYCDCVDKSKCLLALQPGHVQMLHGRQMVPSVSDLDISDVSRHLFRRPQSSKVK